MQTSDFAKRHNLPEISLLEKNGITLENIQQDMIYRFQAEYQDITGDEYSLYPANPFRMMITVLSGAFYQAYAFGEYMFRQNLIQYMDDDVLLNWGANLGFSLNSPKPSQTVLEFGLNDALDFDVTIPAGVRATAGDDVYFATDEGCVIPAGDLSVSTVAHCTSVGAAGDGYIPGEINILADPVVNVSYVKNTVKSFGGESEYSGDRLREEIFTFPSTYSVAGPGRAYAALAKSYSEDIVDVSVVTDQDATVHIYLLLKNGDLPSESYCAAVLDHLRRSARFPDTDRLQIHAPEEVSFDLTCTYFINADRRSAESEVRQAVEDALNKLVGQMGKALGEDINPDRMKQCALNAGAEKLSITTPAYQQLGRNQVAVFRSVDIQYGGLIGKDEVGLCD